MLTDKIQVVGESHHRNEQETLEKSVMGSNLSHKDILVRFTLQVLARLYVD